MVERPQGPAHPDAAERVLLLLLILGVLVYWAFQYHPFVLPNNDWYSFERAAGALGSFELPDGFKRMPVFPALVGWLSPLFSGRQPELHAALVLNQLFSLTTLIALYGVARPLVGRGAILVPALVAATNQFHYNALQPLVDPSLCCFVVLAFWAFVRGSDWQYLAAFAAALSRYEVAFLIPVLFLANVWRDRRFVHHLVGGVVAGSGVLAWTVAGALQGSGGGSYLELMEGMGFQLAPDFVLRSIKEPFAGWYSTRGVGPWLLAGAVGVPVFAGVWHGWRVRRIETLALVGFGLLQVAIIVGFGINKARYVLPTQWIWILCFAWGAIVLRRAIVVRISSVNLARTLGGAALLAAVLLGAFWLPRLVAEPGIGHPVGLELGYSALILVVLGVGTRMRREGLPAAALAGSVALLALCVPLVLGGAVAKQRSLAKVFWANQSSQLVAEWLDTNLQPGERVVLLPRSHVLHLSDLSRDQLTVYADFDADSPMALALAMAEAQVSLAVFTDRGPVSNPSQAHYHRIKHVALAEFFQDGNAVPGFEHLATLEVAAETGRRPVQIYRRIDLGAGSAPGDGLARTPDSG